MSKKFIRILCLVLSVILALGLITGALATIVSAATTTYQLVNLLSEGKIKPLGRTQASKAGDSITADWSGSGFDINVSGDGGMLTIGYKSSYSSYWAILVDGQQIWRAQTAASSGGSTFGVEIPAGKHTVRVVKETQMSNAETAYAYLTTLAFAGTIEKAPANKSLYIEFVGDSITCGDGALGEYEPGVKWLGAHDSATHSYAYYAAQKLNADYSLVARGGIGLFVGISEAEGTAQKKGMQDIYNYVSAYNPTSNGEYSFSRQPDVVFIELGANDSIGSGTYNSISYWKGLMEDFIDQVRSKNPNAEIVLHSTNATKYKALMEIKEARKESDPKIHTFYYAYLGNGSAALDTQYAGHPDYNDLERFGDALAKFLKAQDIVPTYTSTPTYKDIVYYVSENGNDSNDGKTIDTAKKTLNATVNQARTDNGTFAANSRVVVYVQGTVKGSSNNAQGLLTGGILKDANGEKVPVLVTTYNYNGTKAVLNTGHAALNDGNGSVVFYNDVTLKDITFQSTTNETTGYRDRTLCAGYGVTVTYDNVTFDMNGSTPSNNSGWRVTAGTAFGSDALPTSTAVTTVIFKNGDYTNLDFATACLSSGLWKSSTETIYDVPNAQYRLIIEDGAKMSTVYNRYGNLNVGKVETIINGGSVNQYIGTTNGNSASDRRTYKGDVNLTVNGGTIYGTHFSTLSAYVKLEGDINTTINGGIFEITPRDTSGQYDAYLFGGRASCQVENINTTITGGQLYLITDVANVDTAYYFGVSGSGTVNNVTNKISGGLFMPYARGAVGKELNIFLGNHTGTITGTLRNEITGGNFQFGLAGVSDRTINMGSRGVNLAIGKVENVLGSKGSKHGPNMSGVIVKLAGGWAQVGTSSKLSAQPTTCSDTVVVSNTIYGGNYSTLYLGATGNYNSSNGYYSFIKGSVENNIYGGFFQSNVYCAGNGPVYGHVKTNVYGGFFKSIYGGTYDKATVYDGVELNIYDMDEYYPVNPSNSWVICGGNSSGKVPVPMTEGRAAIKFTIAPEKASDLTLNTKLKVGSTDGTSTVAVSGGMFPNGFAVDGKTVGGALASGCTIFNASTGKQVSFASSDASVSGSVAVDKNGEGFTNHMEYYVSEFGLDAYSGTSAATPKKTLRAAFSEVIADNGGSPKFPAGTSLTIYVEGRVNNDAGTGAQQLGGGQILYMDDTHDHVPVTITTLNYNGSNKATIVDNHLASNAGNASAYVVNDLYFKNIDLQSVTNPSNGFADNNLYAAGCAITFDNCSITTDGKATSNANAWKISADHFGTGGFNPTAAKWLPLYGSVTFKNGDYTNLSCVSAVGANSIWRSANDGGSVYSIPEMYCKVNIEDGAKMGTVYTAYGTLGVGSATVEVKGGTVETLVGTNSIASDATKNLTYNTNLITTVSGGTVNNFMGTGNGGKPADTAYYVVINGNVTNTFSGGTVGGAQFSGLNDYVQLNGNLTNTISGGKVEINPTSTENGGHGIFLSGRATVTINGDVTNNITDGGLGVMYKVTGIKSGIYFGLRSGWINGNLTNNISGGEIYTRKSSSDISPSYASIHLAGFSTASVKGTLTNNVSGGSFEITNGAYYFGQQGVSGSTGKVVNVIGDPETGNGPLFKGTNNVVLAGGWGRIGVDNNSGTLPATFAITDTVVISNTIYGGTFGGSLLASLNSTTGDNVTYIKGSVETNIHGGSFDVFYGNGNAPTYGHVKTNIYGGTFNAIYGGRVGNVYDGMELNIFGMTEGENPTGIWAATTNGKVSTVTEGRDAVKLTIDPKTELTLSMPISAGCSGTGTVTGTTKVLVTGGTYTNGFAVKGVTVKEALKTGLVPLKTADNTIVAVTDSMTTTGTDSVKLVSTTWAEDTTSVTLSKTSVGYDGKNNAEVPTETVKFYGSTLVKGTDYTVSYSRNGQATTDLNTIGTVTVTVTAKAPYSGTLSTTYTITRAGAVGEAIADVTERTAAYNVDTVTADDSADLAALKNDIKAILTNNASVLTEEEKTALNGLTTTVEAMEKAISIATTDLNTMDSTINGYDIATVTAGEETQLKMLETALARVKDSNLTAAQKARKQELQAKLSNLQKVITDTASDLAAVKTEAAKYDAATVTADNTAKLTQLAADIAAIPDGNLTADQKAEKKAAADKVVALQKVISDVAAELAAVQTAVNGYSEDTVSEADAAALQTLANRIAAIKDANLTAAQKTEKKAASDKVAALQQKILSTAEALANAKTEADKYDLATVTSADSAKLETLAAQIAAISDSKLSADQKAEKKALADKVAALQQKIADTAAALTAAKTEAGKYDASSVTADDSAKLQTLATDIAAIPDGNLTAAEKAEKKAAADKVVALQKVITDTAAALAAAKTESDKYSTTSVTSDDAAKLTAVAQQIAAISDGNLTAAQKAEKKAVADKITALQKLVADAVEALADAEEEVAKYALTTVTADDDAKLAQLAADLDAISNNNLTAAERADKQVAAEKIEALRQKIADTAKALNDAKTAADKIDGNKVNSADEAALTDLATKLAAIPDGNLTAAQKTEKNGLATKVETLEQILADTAADMQSFRDREAAYKTEQLTTADKAGLQALQQELKNYPTDHLTEAEAKELTDLAASAQDKIEVIEKAEQITGNIGAIEALLAGKTAQNVTSADASTIAAAKRAIEELKSDANLSDADKAKLTQLEEQANALETQLEKADKADELTNTVVGVKPENVELTDKDNVAAAIEQLKNAESSYGSNYTEAEKKALADKLAALEAAMTIIEEVEDVQTTINVLPATAEPDDEKAINDLEAVRAAYAELNERQKGMITDAELEKLDKLAASLRDYKVIAGNKAEWTQKSNKDLTITVNGLAGKFEGVQVDGTTVDSKYYTVKSGSTIVTFSDEFLNSLSKGEHAVKFVYTDGETIGTFTIKEKAASPETGDETNLVLFGLLAIFSVAAAGAVVIGVKKREQF